MHNTTVSLALRNSPALLESTRARIRAIAEELGYQPDPALQALVAYRNGRMPKRRQETVAFVTNWTTKWGWQETPAHAEAYEGAKQKAAQTGFQLEHHWLGEPGMTPKRFCAMLFHRRITGVLLGAHCPDSDALQMMDWARLSVVQLGFSTRGPAVHRVASDYGAAMRSAFRRGGAAGYRRIGVVLPYWRDDAVGRAYTASFLAEQARLPESERVPLLLYGPGEYNGSANPGAAGPAVDFNTFAEWFGRHRPDLIISAEGFVRGQIDRLGISLPADLGYIDLSLLTPCAEIAGVRENAARVGEVALELLAAQLHQNVCGLAQIPTTTLVEGQWSDGASLPAQKPTTRPSLADRSDNPYRQDALLRVP